MSIFFKSKVCMNRMNLNLDNNFTLQILGSTAIETDKEFTFTNYSNGNVFYGYADNLKVYNKALS